MSNKNNQHFCTPLNEYLKIVVIGAGFAGINFIKKILVHDKKHISLKINKISNNKLG